MFNGLNEAKYFLLLILLLTRLNNLQVFQLERRYQFGRGEAKLILLYDMVTLRLMSQSDGSFLDLALN